MLGIKVYPSEDLKSRRLACRLYLVNIADESERYDFAKVTFGGAEVSIGGIAKAHDKYREFSAAVKNFLGNAAETPLVYPRPSMR